MEAIVLCGGLGTRLRSVVKDVPKPMADINGKPFLEFLLENLAQNGFKRIILALGYKAEFIQDYFKKNFQGLELSYSIEQSPLGTGGALKLALNKSKNDVLYLYNGDTYFDINPLNLSLEGQSKICLALKKMNHFDRYGRVLLGTHALVEGFEEKKYCDEGLINGGVYKLRKDIFENFTLEDKFSFEEFLQDHFKALNAKAVVFDDYFIDIGVPQDYEKIQRDFKI